MRNGQLSELTGEERDAASRMPLPGRHNITTLTWRTAAASQYSKNPFVSNNPIINQRNYMFLKLEYNL